ncbi:MAG: hypothetical protein RL619_1228 [Bacteroidota bacterium]
MLFNFILKMIIILSYTLKINFYLKKALKDTFLL